LLAEAIASELLWRIEIDGTVIQPARCLQQGHRSLPGALFYTPNMCRNIRTLNNFDPPASAEEIHASALQYVRKLSGYTKPSQANAEPFDRAVAEVAAVSTRLLESLVTAAPPKDREIEAAKARTRAERRFAA
jgi:hypothetical protein